MKVSHPHFTGSTVKPVSKTQRESINSRSDTSSQSSTSDRFEIPFQFLIPDFSDTSSQSSISELSDTSSQSSTSERSDTRSQSSTSDLSETLFQSLIPDDTSSKFLKSIFSDASYSFLQSDCSDTSSQSSTSDRSDIGEILETQSEQSNPLVVEPFVPIRQSGSQATILHNPFHSNTLALSPRTLFPTTQNQQPHTLEIPESKGQLPLKKEKDPDSTSNIKRFCFLNKRMMKLSPLMNVSEKS